MRERFTFLYFAPGDILVPRVERQCLVHFCDAVHRQGIDMELITLGLEVMEGEVRAEHPLDLYRIRKRFPVKVIPTSFHQIHQDTRPIRYALTRLVTNMREAIRHLRRLPRDRYLVLYCRNYLVATGFLLLRMLTRKKVLVLFESHTLPKRAHQRFILRHVDGVNANSHALARDMVERGIVPADRVIGTHQGIDMELVEQGRMTKEEARRALGLPQDAKVVVYAGKIYWKYGEVELLLEAARVLESDAKFLLVGGRADHVERYRERIANEGPHNVEFTGFVPVTEVQRYLAAADVLILYYPTGIELNSYRSPGKLFEYMGAARPIIVSDFPVLREILGDEETAVTVPPDSPRELAAAIDAVLNDASERTAHMAARALERVRLFSWEARAEQILSFVEKRARAREA